ncbi:MAG: inosine/xanthosine triphosphatase [Gemmatimonadaceae bacterium]
MLIIMPQSLLPWVRKVVVGSTNPVKLAAVRAVIARVAPSATVQSAEVISGVADQPWGDEETQRGAAERARRALAAEDDADLGIGLEGGVVELNGGVRTCAWAAVVTRDGRLGTGGSMAMQLPDRVVALLKSGVELGLAMDTVAQLVDTKRRAGAVGILTAGLIDRQRAYEPLITYALAPFLVPHFYAENANTSGPFTSGTSQPQADGASETGR